MEDMFDFFMPRAIRIERIGKRETSGTFLLRLFDREALEDCERLDGEYFRGRRLRIEIVEETPQTLAAMGHPFRPDAGKKNGSCVTLFVGNIPETAQEHDIRKLFERIRGVTPVAINIRRSGGSRGGSFFAHVRFGTSDECVKASTIAGALLKGNRLRIDWAATEKPVALATNTTASNSGQPGPMLTSAEEYRGRTARVFVGNLTDDMADADILPIFQSFGRIASFRNYKDKHGTRYAYLTFDDVKIAEAAVDELRNSNLVIRGQNVRVDFARQDRNFLPPMPAATLPLEDITDKKTYSRSPSPLRSCSRISYKVPAEYEEPPWETFYPYHGATRTAADS